MAGSVTCFKVRSLWAIFSAHWCWVPPSYLLALRGLRTPSDRLLLNFHLIRRNSWSCLWPLTSVLSVPNWQRFLSVFQNLHAWAFSLYQMNEWSDECQGHRSTKETGKWFTDLSSQTSSIIVGDLYSLLKILHDIIFPVPVGGCDTCPGRQRKTLPQVNVN